MTCPSCGTPNAVGAKFCSECGSRFATTCPACGAVNLPGANLDAAFVAPAGDPFGSEAGREARELFERMGARAFVVQVDALLARAPGDLDRTGARPSSAGLVGKA